MRRYNYIQAPQASGLIENERSISGSHNPFIYLYDVCGCSKLGLCGVALFFIHLMLQPDEANNSYKRK
nr:MAG TPA: hypothetical protein [Caudoviricetes sp.]